MKKLDMIPGKLYKTKMPLRGHHINNWLLPNCPYMLVSIVPYTKDFKHTNLKDAVMLGFLLPHTLCVLEISSYVHELSMFFELVEQK